MGKDTGIAWCDHTFNPWWGCVKVSPACTNCYAATFDKRVGGDHWGATSERRFFGEKHWNEPLKWNRAAEKAGKREKVFCASMADWAEIHADPNINAQLNHARARLFDTIAITPALDWLLLTKRTENIAVMVPWASYATPWPNVWLGTTVENQEYANARIPRLLATPAVVHFLSCEPLLGAIDLAAASPNARSLAEDLDWVIVGCESGAGARPTKIAWYRSLRDQCDAARVAFFFKQGVKLRGGDDDSGDSHRIEIGRGSWTKKIAGVEVIEQPYLDGVQHVAFPAVRPC